MKILVGARSAVSDGHGSVSDWAAAAKHARVDVLCFTETFEHLKHDQWDRYVDQCRRQSDSQVTLLPGLDFDTDLGNRFLAIGHLARPRMHLMTEDGKRLAWTGHLLLGMLSIH
jgi:hypothetical protein